MKKQNLINQILVSAWAMLAMTLAYAGAPLWTFAPVSGYPASVSVSPSGTATIKYTVTNQSHKSHTLVMTAIPGITQVKTAGNCPSPFSLAYQQSCTLTLLVNGSSLSGNVVGGPSVCQQGNGLQCYQPSHDNVLQIKLTNQPPVTRYTVTSIGDAHVTATPASQQVLSGSTTTFTVTPTTGYTAAIASDTCGGTLSGTTYTTGAVTSDCAVAFSTLGDFPAAAGPSNVLAVPGNSQVTLSWTAPTNTGTGTITAYTVTYGPTSGTTFTTTGCATTGATSCTVTGLTNDTAYTFVVKTTTTLSGAIQIGSPSYSSSVTPTNGLVVSPSTLALSGLGGGVQRTLTVTNTSSSLITGILVGTPSPILPGSASVDTTSANACGNAVTSLATGASCTITINPGASATSSDGCTAAGTAPTASTMNITSSSSLVSAEVVVLGYGCQYQGGYLFSIDDTTSATGSIGGKVAAFQDQALQGSTYWSPDGALDSIWGIDETSSTAIPSPTDVPTTLQPGQLNCNGNTDGACDSYNMIQFGYGTAITYSAGICTQPLNNTGMVCTGGATCYTDWYLPAICEMGYDQYGYDSGCGIPPASPTLQNMQSNLVDNGNIGSLTGYYWSSTEYSDNPQGIAWYEYFASGGGSGQFNNIKYNGYGVRCSRALTL